MLFLLMSPGRLDQSPLGLLRHMPAVLLVYVQEEKMFGAAWKRGVKKWFVHAVLLPVCSCDPEACNSGPAFMSP